MITFGLLKHAVSLLHQRLGDLTWMKNHQTVSSTDHFSIPLQIISDVKVFGTTTEVVIRNDLAARS